MVPFRGQEVEVQALGKKWKLARRSLDILDAFARWARTVLPDPLEQAEKAVERLQARAVAISEDKTLTDNVKRTLLVGNQQQQERITRQALEQSASYLAFESPQFQSLLRSPRGAAKMYQLLLIPNHPEVTEELALEIAMSLNPQEVANIEKRLDGSAPPQGNGSAPAASPSSRGR